MNCLVVSAHPLEDSLCATLTNHVLDSLKSKGQEAVLENLYQVSFQPSLTKGERESYYEEEYDCRDIKKQTENLITAEAIALVFPAWWFGFPAILKGWFDRVWGPGMSYDHTPNFGLIKPRLHGLKHMLVVTTYGAPWWIDRLIMRRPIRKVLKIALLSTCAPNCRFDMLSFYKCEDLKEKEIRELKDRIDRALIHWVD